jgi:hypothetical protein
MALVGNLPVSGFKNAIPDRPCTLGWEPVHRFVVNRDPIILILTKADHKMSLATVVKDKIPHPDRTMSDGSHFRRFWSVEFKDGKPLLVFMVFQPPIAARLEATARNGMECMNW